MFIFYLTHETRSVVSHRQLGVVFGVGGGVVRLSSEVVVSTVVPFLTSVVRSFVFSLYRRVFLYGTPVWRASVRVPVLTVWFARSEFLLPLKGVLATGLLTLLSRPLSLLFLSLRVVDTRDGFIPPEVNTEVCVSIVVWYLDKE